MLSYLLSRGLNPDIVAYLARAEEGKNVFIPFTVHHEEYAIHHFLDGSHRAGYGIEETNDQLNTNGTDNIAIALVEGDDAICINVKTDGIYLWLIQSGNSEMVKVADSFADFLSISTDNQRWR